MKAFLSTSLLSVEVLLMAEFCLAAPESVKVDGTSYLKDAGTSAVAAPVLPKASSASTSSPTPQPAAKPTVTPRQALRTAVDDDDEAKPERNYPPPVFHRSTMNVGRQIPVPTQYLPPQVVGGGQNGAVTVVPATPTTFQTVQTGTSMGSDGAGNTTFRDTEISGVVNYGQPIRSVVPVYDSQGRQIGTQVVTVSSNPIVVPVTQTIEIQQGAR